MGDKCEIAEALHYRRYPELRLDLLADYTLHDIIGRKRFNNQLDAPKKDLLNNL